MVQVTAGIIIAYLITYFLLPLIIRIAHNNKLYDIPDERKIHSHEVSSLGGIAIFSGLILSLLLVSDGDYTLETQYYITSFFVIFLLGVTDDIFCLQTWKKILGQLFVTAMLTFKGGLLITSLHGFLGINELTHTESICTSFFTILLLINSFNLIDGIDGLAGSLGFIACIFFGTFFFINNNFSYAVLSFSMCGALLGFLMYNFPPAKIFMGDSGSTLIGLMCAILSIKFIENTAIQADLGNRAVPAIAFGFLIIPLMDVLRVFALRIAKKQSPLVPDRNHLHHLLQNKGFSHTEVTITLVSAQFLFAGLTFLIQKLDLHLVIAIQFILYFGLVFILKRFIPVRKNMHIVRDELVDDAVPNIKVYTIYQPKEKISSGKDS
jgi:UDP-N-acetylmuramyl pentapeptide phosphotransferase/UDP-N-acetylglucosamine-1-phosphate transferase